MTHLPLIMVAPNGARRKRADHPAVPITIAETVATAKACFEAGAGGLHAHVRDENQDHVLDAGLYRELIAEMELQVPDMLVQITTEAVGRYSAQQQRQLVRDVRPSAVSIGLNEMLSDGDLRETANLYHFAVEKDVAVQHILYSTDDLKKLSKLIDDGVIPRSPIQLLFVLGRYTRGQESDPAGLLPFIDFLNNQAWEADWGVCAFGKNETACLKAARNRGGKLRVGFENSLWCADGSLAENNAQRVREISVLTE